MKRLSLILVTVFTLAISSHATVAGFDSRLQSVPVLDWYTAWQVVWMYDQEKLARDLNLKFSQRWGERIFANIAESEQRHMDELAVMIVHYDLSALIETDEIGVFGDDRHSEAFSELSSRGEQSLLEALRATAYLEEWDIKELNGDIESIAEQPLLDTFSRVLAGASNHLRVFVAKMSGLGYTYQAQMLTQSDVDLICGDVDPQPSANFSFNAELNDAWYYPGTIGQGFFVTVYPDSHTVFLAWLTYDTELPVAGATSNLGHASQRWLTASGTFVGGQANMTVYSCGGGIFDENSPEPAEEAIGSMLLRFEDCSSGSIFYDLPAIGRSGTIPIRRVSTENVAKCELINQSPD